MSEVANGKRRNTFNEKLASALRNDVLRLVLLPTEKCNFRCTYCYEAFLIGRMSSSTIQGIRRFIDRRVRGLHLLHISWFGGEPLVARPVIEDISQPYCNSHSREK
jgi:uncharacterized protein